MGYANPKPRTILKDFKIFEWENLERGMRKVLQRYHPKVGGQSAVEPIPGRRRHARSSVSVQAGSWRGGRGNGVRWRWSSCGRSIRRHLGYSPYVMRRYGADVSGGHSG
jgi:hypothetical protein